MGSISLGTLTLSQQQRINNLIKEDIEIISSFVLKNNYITILFDDSISFSVACSLSKLILPNINMIYDISGVSEFISIKDDNIYSLLKNWTIEDLINYIIYF